MKELNDLIQHNPHILFMCGLPGSGKTTWLNQWRTAHPEQRYYICDTDSLIEEQGRIYGWGYNEAFEKLNKDIIEDLFYEDLFDAFELRRNVIIDQTNLTYGARKRKLAYVPEEYKTGCIVLQPSYNIILERLSVRYADTGKFIPLSVINHMCKIYKPPSQDEFHYIIYINEGQPVCEKSP